jgi:hypothetical protein
MLRRGREGFAQAAGSRGAAVALCNKQESQETFFTELAIAWLVGTP